jgi:outer membrane lipoprotein-sorting protein
MPVSRRAFLGALLALPATLGTAHAALPPKDAETVAEVEAYLNGFRTLKAAFSQVAPNGALATGTLWIDRPGRMRLDYDPPSKILIVATDWRVVYYDSAIEQMNVIPARETPLGFILAEKIDLSQGVRITEVSRASGEIALRVVRADAPDQGNVVLYFSERPVELRRWTVTDPQGLQTTIILENAQYDVPMESALFRAPDPEVFGWPQ